MVKEEKKKKKRSRTFKSQRAENHVRVDVANHAKQISFPRLFALTISSATVVPPHNKRQAIVPIQKALGNSS